MKYLLVYQVCSLAYNVMSLQEVANFVTGYFRLLLKFLRNVNVILLINFAISCNDCYGFGFLNVSIFGYASAPIKSRKQFKNYL
jgi:hypothetical protein